jgi:hypothetical protein
MWPFFPSLMAFLPFTSKSLLQAPGLSPSFGLGSCARYLRSLALSPFVLWYVLSYCKGRASTIIATYIQYGIPRPQNPDKVSLKGAEVDGYSHTSILGLGTVLGKRSLLGEVKRYVIVFTQHFRNRLVRWRSIWDGRHVEVKRRDSSGSVIGIQQFLGTNPSDTITRNARNARNARLLARRRAATSDSVQTSNDSSNVAPFLALRAVLRETRSSFVPFEFAPHKGSSWYLHGYEGPSANIPRTPGE